MIGIKATFQNVDSADLAARRISAAVAGVCDISLKGLEPAEPVLQAAVAPFATTSGISGLGAVTTNHTPPRKDVSEGEGTLLLRAPEESSDQVRSIIINAGGYDFHAEQL